MKPSSETVGLLAENVKNKILNWFTIEKETYTSIKLPKKTSD